VSPAIYGLVLVYYFLEARRNGCLTHFGKACALFIGTGTVIVAPLALYFINIPRRAAGRSSPGDGVQSLRPIRRWRS